MSAVQGEAIGKSSDAVALDDALLIMQRHLRGGCRTGVEGVFTSPWRLSVSLLADAQLRLCDDSAVTVDVLADQVVEQ